MRGGEYVIPFILLFVVVALAVFSRRDAARAPRLPPTQLEEVPESAERPPSEPVRIPTHIGLRSLARFAESMHDRLVERADQARRKDL